MIPAHAEFGSLLGLLASSRNAREAAIADNYLFEERAGAARQQVYEGRLTSPLADMSNWRTQHDKHHVVKRIKAGGDHFIPDTFLECNESAQLPSFAKNLVLVRVEDLSYALSKSTARITYAQLADAINRRKEPDAAATLELFIHDWNAARANWPMFGSIYHGEVKEDADHADWPHRLRDRLGLDHYQGSAADRIPVALMCYSAQLVLDEAKGDSRINAAFALPTALDGELNHAYFPAPAGHPYGATLNLSEPWQAQLGAEILNLRIKYQPGHLLKVGEIVRPTGYRDVRVQRDKHLELLRQETGNSGFGKILAGRP